ncbi:MAG TPA: J domain-containing protein [Gemmataceae bacterium]|nr:J domain-containing protein [Gemmataceae bacterium]
MARDYYETLGVKRDASDNEIKSAYRKLARQYHPDRNPGDKQAETKFKEVQEAYDVLSDKTKRAQYDRFGAAGPGAFRDFTGGAGGPEFQWGPGPGGFQEMDPRQAADLFRQFFGGGGGAVDMDTIFGQQGPRRGRSRGRRAQPTEEAEAEVTIPFQTAAVGGNVSLQIDGRELSVKVPAGVEEGQALRLHGQAPGGGDLRLRLHIHPHPFFRREGKDVILSVPLSVAEAILGTTVDVPTLDGARLSVKVPPGTSSGTRLRIRGRGIAGGDQYIETKIVVPPAKDERSRQLMEEFARLHPQNPREGLW